MKKLYGSKVVLAERSICDMDAAEKGYRVLSPGTWDIKHTLHHLGYLDACTLLQRKFKNKPDHLHSVEKETYKQTRKKIQAFLNAYDLPPIPSVKWVKSIDAEDTVEAQYKRDEETIYISTEHLRDQGQASQPEWLAGVIMHEYAHHHSHADDHSRDFENEITEYMGRAIYASPGKYPESSWIAKTQADEEISIMANKGRIDQLERSLEHTTDGIRRPLQAAGPLSESQKSHLTAEIKSAKRAINQSRARLRKLNLLKR